MKLSFYDWCIENDHNDLLNMWDNGENDCLPKDVTYRSDKKIKFSCGDPRHPVKFIRVASVTDPNRTGLTQERFCVGCHSVGQYLIDNYGEEYLENIWSDKNELSPFEIAANSKANRIWLRCLNNPIHPDYDIQTCNVHNAFGCPYCRNRRVCDDNNLAVLHPEVYEYWSEKNTTCPSEHVASSHDEVWFKCPIENHNDYLREIRFAVKENFQCPICLCIESANNVGHPFYYIKNQPITDRNRFNSDYIHWRIAVFARDNYTCQCCGAHGIKLNAHHIYSYKSYHNLRYCLGNGITLCEHCHDLQYTGSLHNTYGIMDVSPKELEEFVNNKRKQLGINDIFSVKKYTDSIDEEQIKEIA